MSTPCISENIAQRCVDGEITAEVAVARLVNMSVDTITPLSAARIIERDVKKLRGAD